MKRNWSRPDIIDFNNWLKDKAEAHEQMKNMPGNPFSGQSAVINQPNVPLMSQWTPAVAQCIAGVTSDGNTNPSVGIFSSVTPISQQQFPHVSSSGTV